VGSIPGVEPHPPLIPSVSRWRWLTVCFRTAYRSTILRTMDIVCYRTACPGCYSLPQSLSIADSGYAITELRGRSYLLEWADNPTWEPHRNSTMGVIRLHRGGSTRYWFPTRSIRPLSSRKPRALWTRDSVRSTPVACSSAVCDSGAFFSACDMTFKSAFGVSSRPSHQVIHTGFS